VFNFKGIKPNDMKKTVLFLMCIIVALTSKSQDQINRKRVFPWGTWGIGIIKNDKTLDIYEPYHIEGYQIYYDWAKLEPTKGNFQWDRLDSEMRIVANRNIWIAVQIMVGPNCPEWIYGGNTNVPKFYTSGGNDDGPYPWYFDANYKERYYLLLKRVANHFNNLPSDLQSHFLYWQISEGSTGDEQPYKGTPVDSIYTIDYYAWQDFRHAAWDSVAAYAGPQRRFKFLFNDGNAAQDLQYVDDKFPYDFHKDGFLSHHYSFDGEAFYYARQYRHLNSLPRSNRGRGEIQDIFNTTWWNQAPVKQAFALSCSAASGGLDMINVTPNFINSIFGDTRPIDFYDTYAGLRKPKDGNVGFIALRDVPDLQDSFRFPEAIYGPVIDPSRQKGYENRIKTIVENPRDSSAHKFWQISQAEKQFLNPARVEKIVAEFAPAGAMYNEEGDDYHNDFAVNVTTNWARFIQQWDPDSTSYGAWRIGPDSSIYGRYARFFKLRQRANHQGAMFFLFNDSLVKRYDRVAITVTYYDSGNGQWSMNCSEESIKVHNTDTRQWLQQTMTINSFIPEAEFDGRADLSLRYHHGDNTPFTLIQVQVLPSNTNSEQTKVTREALDVKVSPNPNTGQFNVSFTANKAERYSVYITDESGGAVYYNESKTGVAGNNVWNLSSSGIRRGSYILHVESPTTVSSAKFLIIK
jgi:hypothetical protein